MYHIATIKKATCEHGMIENALRHNFKLLSVPSAGGRYYKELGQSTVLERQKKLAS
jgi:hypothetical protein